VDWTDLTLTVPVNELETAEAVASLFADGNFYTEDYSHLEEAVEEIAHIDLIDEELLARDRTHAKLHVYLPPEKNPAEEAETFRERLRAAALSFTLSSSLVREEDWANGWRQFYHPFPVGERLFVLPEWQDAPQEAEGRTVLRLDPGAAFGTGSHETTRLCLTVLEKHAPSAARMLDVGCGSGILAIAAAKLGAKEAVGVDIDPVAVRVANENAALNKVTNATFLCGDLDEAVTGTFDLIAANLVTDIIKRLLSSLPARMNPGATAVFSGIIDTRGDEAAEAIAAAGLTVVSVLRERGWVAIEARMENGKGKM